ncbi:MAG: DUF420 domain-containing protein [Flavobacteriales bacterium]
MLTYQKTKRLIWIVSAVVALLVSVLHKLPAVDHQLAFVKQLPLLHACINGTCFVLLLLALRAIKTKNIALHRKLMTITMSLSLLFLLSYVIHHSLEGNTKYLGDYKGMYYFTLITHIILAGVSLPFILLAYAKAYFNRLEEHKKMVRFVFPIWLYVTLTGVVVYLFLAPYYN